MHMIHTYPHHAQEDKNYGPETCEKYKKYRVYI